MTELTPPPTQTAARYRLRSVFFGRSELRAGWRLLVFIALLYMVGAVTDKLTAGLVPPLQGVLGAGTILANEARRFFVVFVASYVMTRLERRTIAEYGLPARQAFRANFWSGSLWGFAMVSIIIALMAVTRSYTMGDVALATASIFRFGVLWALAFLAVGFLEEFAFRGYVQYTLTTGMGFWPAAAITCAVFAFVHSGNPGENWVGLLNIVLIAAFLCLALRRTGSLWFPIGWHMAFDWGESFFYSVPDSGTHVVGHLFNATIQGNKWLSGGSVGPEASVFNVLVTVVGIVVFTRFYPVAQYPRVGSTRDSSAPRGASRGPALPAA